MPSLATPALAVWTVANSRAAVTSVPRSQPVARSRRPR
jgi:hypothetical protein